ncbi:MAG TPA: hypothetical protein VJX92_13900 [Methylomirabilota bacterium]|nr:hypothetical protein [Methylomirabilota bacterium]
MNIEIRLVKLGKLHMAATVLGGVQVRGRSAGEPGDAVRNLFWKLAGKDGDDDAQVAVELALENIDLNAEMQRPQLTAGAAGDGASS